MPCHTCQHIPYLKTYNFLQRGASIPHEIDLFNGWKGIILSEPEENTSEYFPLQCPSCGDIFTAEYEWYEFNDSGRPFTHQLTITRKKI